MKIRVLGCSGGIGTGLRTTSFLIDDDILLDAGTGVGDLDATAMARIRHIFLTHSHLDHILSLPLLVDSIFDLIDEPIQVHAQPATLNAMRAHIFNGSIWPDFTRLPHPERPVLRFCAMEPGTSMSLGGRSLEMIPVNHVVPGVAFRVACETGAFAFSGDTTTNDTLWEGLNRCERLDLLFIEAAFSNSEEELCRLARHYSPRLLSEDLKKLRHDPKIYLSHAKPGEEDKIFEECRRLMGNRRVRHLAGGDVFTL